MVDSSHAARSRTRFWAAIVAVSALLVASAVAVQRASVADLPEANQSGFFQGDMPSYMCFARASHPSTVGLSYHSPHDIRDPADAAHLVNAPIAVMGLALDAGFEPATIAMAMRVAFGMTMFLSLAFLLSLIFGRGRLFWAAFVLIAAGGGFAWVGAWSRGYGDLTSVEGLSALTTYAASFQGRVYWWFLQLYQNLWYPLELVYHSLMFAMLAALTLKRWRVALGLLAIGCLCTPFVGVQMSAVFALSATMAFRRPDFDRRVAVGASVIIGLFIAFYLLYLPADPIVASLQAQHRASHGEALLFADMRNGYGPALLGLIAAGYFAFRCGWKRDWTIAPAMALLFATFALTQHSRVFEGLMPLHFARGYLHTALWIATFWGAAKLWSALADRSWKTYLYPASQAALGITAVAALVGTTFFAAHRLQSGPGRPNLVWDDDHAEVLAYLADKPSTRILAPDRTLGTHLCSLLDHQSAFGTPLTTPQFEARMQALERYAQNGPSSELVDWAQVLVAPAHSELRRRAQRDPHWRSVLANARWAVFERASTDEKAYATR